MLGGLLLIRVVRILFSLYHLLFVDGVLYLNTFVFVSGKVY